MRIAGVSTVSLCSRRTAQFSPFVFLVAAALGLSARTALAEPLVDYTATALVNELGGKESHIYPWGTGVDQRRATRSAMGYIEFMGNGEKLRTVSGVFGFVSKEDGTPNVGLFEDGDYDPPTLPVAGPENFYWFLRIEPITAADAGTWYVEAFWNTSTGAYAASTRPGALDVSFPTVASSVQVGTFLGVNMRKIVVDASSSNYVLQSGQLYRLVLIPWTQEPIPAGCTPGNGACLSHLVALPALSFARSGGIGTMDSYYQSLVEYRSYGTSKYGTGTNQWYGGKNSAIGLEGENWAYAVYTSSDSGLVPPDIDQDGDVDSTDFGHLQRCFTTTGEALSADCYAADFRCDGDVDADDLKAFLACESGPEIPVDSNCFNLNAAPLSAPVAAPILASANVQPGQSAAEDPRRLETCADCRDDASIITSDAPLATSLSVNSTQASPVVQGPDGTFTDPTTNRIIFMSFTGTEPAALGPQTKTNTAAKAVPLTDAQAIADAFLNADGLSFGLTSPSEELAVVNSKEDELGMRHIYYEQRVGGIPVLGSGVTVHLNAQGEVSSASAEIVPGLAVEGKGVTASITAQQAVDKAMTEAGKTAPKAKPSSQIDPSLTVFAPGLHEHTANTKGFLTWQVRLVDQVNSLDSTYLVDAHTGELRQVLENVRRATQRQIYDASTGTARLDYYDATYNYTFGRSEGQPPRGPNPLSIPVTPRARLTDVDDAYTIFGWIDQYTNTVVGINGANRHGGLASDLSGTTAAIAFDTDSRCASYNYGTYSGGQVRMCINSAYPDMAAHEYGHGISSYAASPLSYYGEPGALSESYSDIFAETLSNYVFGFSDWSIGAPQDFSFGGLYNLSNGGMVSYTRMLLYPNGMQENNVTGCSITNYKPYPDRYRSPNWYCGSSDLGGLHHNATVVGKAAAMLAEGSVFNDCKIEPIGAEKVQKICFRAVDTYFSGGETFNGAYSKLIQASADLYGAGSFECTQVTRALQAVEMDQPGYCSGGTTRAPYCRDSHPSCTDTDNGIMPYKVLPRTGSPIDTDSVTVSGDPAPHKDYNFTSKTVVEYYCDGNTVKRVLVPCWWGGQDGRCLVRNQNICSNWKPGEAGLLDKAIRFMRFSVGPADAVLSDPSKLRGLELHAS